MAMLAECLPFSSGNRRAMVWEPWPKLWATASSAGHMLCWAEVFKALNMKSFHEVQAGNVHECSLN